MGGSRQFSGHFSKSWPQMRLEAKSVVLGRTNGASGGRRSLLVRRFGGRSSSVEREEAPSRGGGCNNASCKTYCFFYANNQASFQSLVVQMKSSTKALRNPDDTRGSNGKRNAQTRPVSEAIRPRRLADGINVACHSSGRGNAKTALCAGLALGAAMGVWDIFGLAVTSSLQHGRGNRVARRSILLRDSPGRCHKKIRSGSSSGTLRGWRLSSTDTS